MKKSAGILAFKKDPELQVLLVHPGGPFYRNKDAGSWTIPKGEIDEHEDHLEAAKREFFEETGIMLNGQFMGLQPIKQKSGKQVFCWAIEQEINAGEIVSNFFELEWPPRSGKLQQFPEVDKAAWFTIEEAKTKILEAQIPLLTELEELV
jgi:predicted NUDIX family NTP pyrophosphohydrolase